MLKLGLKLPRLSAILPKKTIKTAVTPKS